MEQTKKQYSISSFCKILPKIELHAHLNGSLNTDILKKLGCNNDAIAEYQLTDIMSKSSRTLEEVFQLFNVAHNATKTKENVYLAAKSVIEDFDKENTVYLELRTTPRSEEEMSEEEYVETVIKAITDCKETCKKVLVKLLLSINRRANKESSMKTLDVIIKMKDKYPDIIKGIDLSGNPMIGTFDEDLFEKARQAGLKTAIHCAEVKNDEEVSKILKFGPDRIGHGIFLHPHHGGSQENWDLYCEKKIPLECCLTSNVLSESVEHYGEHHIQKWIDLRLPFSINTDDKGVFATTLSKEYEHVLRHFKLTPQELWNISYESMGHSFASEEEKKDLQQKLAKWYFHVQDTLISKINLININDDNVDHKLYDQIDIFNRS
ncbi:unnamed protein product [Diabrotica balteata]|uniref:Adenosine deaminase domain-containing protein n=1 Tax=Diabrotica balteata TaxID=107213 RepID=A0A9N9T639_DIABA|nr:unnamed protein product [Diabrotica balteata]